MQEFLENGNLSPGIHGYTINEFEEQFVKGFSDSNTREIIYKNFLEWFEILKEIVPPRYIWLDGSYLTNKLDPNDIDLVIFYQPEDITSAEIAHKLGQTIQVLSRQYRCDAYLCYILDHYPPEVLAQIDQKAQIMQTYWMGQFCFDRQRSPKGVVEILQEELLSLGGVENGVSAGTN